MNGEDRLLNEMPVYSVRVVARGARPCVQERYIWITVIVIDRDSWQSS